MQSAAVFHGRAQGHHKGAIRADGSCSQQITRCVTHLHGGAGFATAAQLAAGQADDQVGRGFRRRGVAPVDIRRSDRAGYGCIASGIGRGGLQDFAVNLWGVEVDAEHAGWADYSRAQFGAIGSNDTHSAAGFGTAGDDAAVSADGQFGRCGRRGDVRRGDLCGQRGNATVIDGDHIQQFAVGLGRAQLDAEGAVGIGDGAADQGAIGVMHLHARPCRGGAGEGGAVGIDGQIARAVRRGGQRYVVLHCHGSVAAWVGLHQAQLLTWLHSRVEVDQEGAVGTDHTGTDHGAVGIAYFDSGARFAAAAQGQAIRADHDIAYCARWRDIRGIELKRCRGVAGGIRQAHIQGFAVGLCRVQGQAEQAIGAHSASADESACGITHLHGSARFAATGEGHAVSQGQLGRLGRGLQVWRGDRSGWRDIASGIGQGHLQSAAVFHGRAQGHHKGAIRADGSCSQQITRCVTHLHGGAGFATAAQLAAGQADDQVGRGFRRRGVAPVDIRRSDRAGYGCIASGIGRGGLQDFAVNLWGVEVDAEHAGWADYSRAQFGAIGSHDTHSAARFGTAGQDGAIRADGQLGRGTWGGDVRGCEFQWYRTVASGIDLADVQYLAIGLGGRKGEAEGTVGVHQATADEVAGGIAHLHGGAGFAATGKVGALFIDREVGRCQWRGCVRGGDGAWRRDISGAIGQGDFKVLAVDLRWVQRHVEAAVGTHGAAADQVASGIADVNRGARFTAAAQAQAIRRHQQVDRRGRCGGVGVGTAAAATAAVVCRCRCAAHAEQAEPGNRPGRHGTAGGADTRYQFVQRGHVFEGKAGERCRIVLGMPQGAVFADEDHVAADPGLVHGEEVADGDLFTRLEGDDQVLPALGNGSHLVGRYRHLHDAWPFEIDIAPGALRGDFGLLIGDDDVVHGCSLLVSGSPGPTVRATTGVTHPFRVVRRSLDQAVEKRVVREI